MDVSSLSLTVASVVFSLSLANKSVMKSTTLTLNANFSDRIESGFIDLTVDHGAFGCSGTVTINGTAVTPSMCSGSAMTLPVAGVNGSVAISMPYTNPISVTLTTVTLKARSTLS